jgi:hypothetical protein
MKTFVRSLSAVWAVAWLLAAGCATSAATPPLPENYNGAYEQVRQWVPLGTTLANAQKIMASHGFTCSVTRNAPWDNQSNVDYLYCDEVWAAPSDFLVMKRRWQVALFLTDDKVSSVYLATGLVGQ